VTSPAESYDAVIIGTGQGGKPLARALARAGRSVAIIERDRVGGSCVNVGCTPTKTMVASARVAYLARRAADYGVVTGPVSVNQAIIRERKRRIAASFSEGNRRGLERTEGLDLILGEASFASTNQLDVRLEGGLRTRLTGDRIFINTGLRPAIPSVPGLESVDYLDSTTIMELDEVPEHLLVVGGGYIGLEFGQMFRRFGAGVTVIDRNDRLLHREDQDISDAIAGFLTEDGVALYLGSKLEGVRSAAGTIELDVREDGVIRTLSGSHLLLAAGRRPNTETLRLEKAGVEIGPGGYVAVNGRLETSVPGIYAMGDVTGGPAFTHISYDDYRIIAANLLDGADLTTKGRPIPFTLYTDPQFGRVGITEKEARDEALDVLVAKMPMAHVARALESDESRGFMKAIVEAKSGRILGCAVVGIEGGELMSMMQIAMMGDLPFTALRDAIFAHPTLAESLNNLFAGLEPRVTM
jgi:pyruvate/2-oxoglutarate dehydrogenase complex dihydrolipoamide dehydrogenase (E3) component